MPKIVIDYKPTPKQRMFHETDADEVLYGGAAGGGKSKAIVMDALMRCLRYPGTTAFLFRRTYTELEDTLIKEARGSYPEGIGRYNAGRHEYQLLNGSMICFRHCATVSDMNNYRGSEIHWLYFDELTSFEMEIYEFLKTRLRAKKNLGIVPVTRSASNPGDIGHGWVKARFVDAGPYGEKLEKREWSETLRREHVYVSQYIPSLATENPYITDDYIRELERKPEALRKALLEGNWDAFEGQVFSEWCDDPAHYADRRWTHVIDPFPIPDHWKRYMGFDYGFTRPFSVGWWAASPDGCLYRYREWYGWDGQPNKGQRITPPQIAEGILRREAEEETANNIYVDRYADPSIFDKSRGLSIADQMEPVAGNTGIYFTPGDNARIAGKMQVHERLRMDASGKPKLQVFRTCAQFIRTLPVLPYDGKKPEDVNTDSEDHIYDEVRYVLMANPLPGAEPKSKRTKPYSPFEEG